MPLPFSALLLHQARRNETEPLSKCPQSPPRLHPERALHIGMAIRPPLRRRAEKALFDRRHCAGRISQASERDCRYSAKGRPNPSGGLRLSKSIANFAPAGANHCNKFLTTCASEISPLRPRSVRAKRVRAVDCNPITGKRHSRFPVGAAAGQRLFYVAGR